MSSAAVAPIPPEMSLIQEKPKILPQENAAVPSARRSSHTSPKTASVVVRPSKCIAPATLNRHRSSDGYMSSFLAPPNVSAGKQPLPQANALPAATSSVRLTLVSPPNPASKSVNRRHAFSLSSPPRPLKKNLSHRSISMNDAPRLGGSTASISTKPRLRRNSSSSSSTLSQVYDETDDCVLEDLVEILQRRRQVFGDSHIKVGQSFNRLGNCHYRRGEFDDAAASYMSAMECFRKGVESELGSFASSFVLSLSSSIENSCATTTKKALVHPFTVKSQQQSWENCRKRLMGVAVTLSNLGALFWRTGRVDDAICSLEESLEIHMRTTTKPSDTISSGVYGTSAKSNEEEGRTMTFDDYYYGGRRNVDGAESTSPSNSSLSSTGTCSSLSSGSTVNSCTSSNISGTSNNLKRAGHKLDVACTLYNLGIARCLRGDLDEALDAFVQCRSVQMETFGTCDHVEVARAVDGMGRVYLQMDLLEEAMECHQEALRVKRLLMGPRHPSVICAMLNKTAVHRRLGETNEAIAVMEEVVRAQRSLLRIVRRDNQEGHRGGNSGTGAKNPYRTAARDYASSLHLLGDLHWENGNVQAASYILAQAMEVFVKDGGLVAGLGFQHKTKKTTMMSREEEESQYIVLDEEECDPRVLAVKRSQEEVTHAASVLNEC